MGREAAFVADDGSGPVARPELVKEPEGEAEAKVEVALKPTPWHVFLKTAKEADIQQRLGGEILEILKKNDMGKYCTLALLEPEDTIDSFDLDKVFGALSELNRDRNKDVMLLLLSSGGRIEPAYQISKLCKSFAAHRFLAVVPRQAKSAATLIALGADEIHMGLLSQLGPIDPQLGALPALGVSQALRTIASVAQRFPGSADMFARYLQRVLTVEQIGYCDRISESAEQYAVRLLSTKTKLAKKPELIAKGLVHEYKDHGFVIDIEEAKMHLGADWIKSETPELAAAEAIYTHFEMVNFLLRFGQSKRLIITGGASLPDSIIIFDNKD